MTSPGDRFRQSRTRSLSRRQFIKAGAATTLTLALSQLHCGRSPSQRDAGAASGTAPAEAAVAESAPGATVAAYGDWRDIYREQWQWDRIVHSTHSAANCVAACAWNLYVRDGLVWSEEQAAPYKASNAALPDWNPRGCQKGACYSELSYGPTRITHPLKRVGPRGGGAWKRITWDEALEEIAAATVDTLARRGGHGVVCETGGNLDYGPSTAGTLRFFGCLGAPLTATAAQTGDLPVGGTITLGLPFTDGSSDDWFRSDYLVLWAFNPSATRIPDAHYLNEARYAGARVVSIAPDYNQSAIHSDTWLSPRPGTDAALALAACQVLIAEDLYDADYVTEQSDLPLLLREDTRRFLRRCDLEEGGGVDEFAVWDNNSRSPAWVPGCAGSKEKTLELPARLRPALDARETLRLAGGEEVAVRTVFSLLREELERFTPEHAARITGVAPALIRRFAHDFARARSALIISQFGMCKNYHSDLIQRSQILLASLSGNLGRAGGGWRSGAFVALDGLGLVAMQEKLDILHLVATAIHSYFDRAAVMKRFVDMFVSGTLFHAAHGGIGDVQLDRANGDPALPAGARPYFDEALAKGHFPAGPPQGEDPPEVIFSAFGNVLRHSKMGDRIRDSMFAKAKLVVDVTFRMSTTARAADILLPAATWYEKVGMKKIPTVVPYLTLGDRATAPIGESKGEWEIFSLLAAKVAAEAKRRGVSTTKTHLGTESAIAQLDSRFSDDGRFGPDAEEQVLEFMLSVSEAAKGVDLETLRTSKGALRLPNLGPQGGTAGIFSDYSSDEPVVPLRDFVEKKRPYPTLTGRQQFYIDHPWFLELGEALPTHKEPPAAGGAHPLTLTSGHTRWSIHSMWRDHSPLLRLQRGEPLVWINGADAAARGIGDNDRVRVYNDLGAFHARAKLAASIRPGQAHMFHAWEAYQFEDGLCHQVLAPSPIKVTQLVGDYGHLHWGFGYYEPNQVDRDTRVDVERA